MVMKKRGTKKSACNPKKTVKKAAVKKTIKIKPAKSIAIAFKQAMPENEFYLIDGRRFKDMRELAIALIDMPEDIFRYHVNDEKNDFARWICDILEDKELAKKLEDIKDKMLYADAVNKRLKK